MEPPAALTQGGAPQFWEMGVRGASSGVIAVGRGARGAGSRRCRAAGTGSFLSCTGRASRAVWTGRGGLGARPSALLAG